MDVDILEQAAIELTMPPIIGGAIRFITSAPVPVLRTVQSADQRHPGDELKWALACHNTPLRRWTLHHAGYQAHPLHSEQAAPFHTELGTVQLAEKAMACRARIIRQAVAVVLGASSPLFLRIRSEGRLMVMSLSTFPPIASGRWSAFFAQGSPAQYPGQTQLS